MTEEPGTTLPKLKYSRALAFTGANRCRDKPEHWIKRIMDFLSFILSIVKIHAIAIYFTITQLLSHHNKFEITSKVIEDNKGRWAVVTGGSRGIGLEVVRKFYACHMNVIVGCRNERHGANIIKKLQQESYEAGNRAVIHVCHLDLTSLESVKTFAQTVINMTSNSVHVLVNNAGVMFPTFELTEDGFGNQMQTNHLGHFALIGHLVPTALHHGGTAFRKARVVNVSSVAHYGADTSTDKTGGILDYTDEFKTYMDSKFCQIATSIRWNEYCRGISAHIKVLNVHPGIVNTALYKNIFYYDWIGPLMRLMYMTPAEGSDCVVYAALSPELEHHTPLFLVNSKETEPSQGVLDEEVLETVWRLSCQATDRR